MHGSFPQLARTGRTSWWRHVLAILTILGSWLLLGGVAAALLPLLDGDPVTTTDPRSWSDGSPMLGYLVVNVPFVFLLIGLVVAVRVIHRRSLRTLVTPAPRIAWRRVGLGLTLYVTLLAVAGVIAWALDPGDVRVSFEPARFLLFLPVVLVLTTLQAGSEELLFRGYVIQTAGLRIRQPLVLASISAVLFLTAHLGNRELGSGFLLLSAYYFGFGLLFALVTLRDDNAELAIGAHVGNNLYGALVIGFAESSLQTPTIFRTTGEFRPGASLLVFLAVATAFYLVTSRWGRVRTPATAGVGSGR